jgi:hypothetical protein
VALVVECVPSKNEALSSNSSTAQKKKKEKQIKSTYFCKVGYYEFQKHITIFHFFGEGCRTGVWTQDFMLANQESYCWSHTSNLFCSGYFRDGIFFLICLFICAIHCLSHSSPLPPIPSHPRDGILQSICLDWPQTSILPISASQIARTIGISH